MEHLILCVFDNVSNSYMLLSSSPTSASFIRENIKFLIASRPLKDLSLFELGKIDISTMEINLYSSPVLVSWDSYKVPLSAGDSLSPLNLSQDVVEKIDSQSANKE